MTYGWHMSKYEWHMDGIRVHTSDIGVHTSDIRMVYEYIRVTYGWHTSTYEWHTDDIRVHTSDIRMKYVMSLLCTGMSFVCRSYVIRMSLVCTRMSSFCHSYAVLACHLFVTVPKECKHNHKFSISGWHILILF